MIYKDISAQYEKLTERIDGIAFLNALNQSPENITIHLIKCDIKRKSKARMRLKATKPGKTRYVVLRSWPSIQGRLP